MDIKEADDVFKAPRKFLQQAQQEIQQLSQQQVALPKALLKQQQDRLESLKKQLKVTIEAKEMAIRRYDEQIERHNAAIGSLEKEIEALQRAAKSNRG